MTIKNRKPMTALELQTVSGQPEQTAPMGGHPVDGELLVDANVGIGGGCIQPGGAEDDRPNTGAPCHNSMDGG